MDLSKEILLCTDEFLKDFIKRIGPFPNFIVHHMDDEAQKCIIRQMNRYYAYLYKEEIIFWKNFFITTEKKLDEVMNTYHDSKNNGCILFTNLVNSTFKINLMGDEDYYEDILLKHNTVLLDSIKENDGRVIKNIGDAYLAIFGGCFDALRCCIQAQNNLNRMNEGRDAEDKIFVRMALHYGDYSIKQAENNSIDVYGSSINYAARMVGNTGGGQISVSKAFLDGWEKIDYNESIESIKYACDLLDMVKLEQKLYNSINFNPIGLFNFKGFENEQELYSVDLSENMYKLSENIQRARKQHDTNMSDSIYQLVNKNDAGA